MNPCSHSPSEIIDVTDILKHHHKLRKKCLKCGKVFERWERIT